MASQFTPENVRAWGSAVSQIVGYTGLFACLVIWLAVDRFNPVIFGGFGTLAGLGQQLGALKGLRG